MFIVTECLQCGGKQYVGSKNGEYSHIISWIKSQNNHALYASIINGNYAALLMLFQNRKMNNYADKDENKRCTNMFRKVEIISSPSKTKIIADGKDITNGVVSFECNQRVGEELPSITLEYHTLEITFSVENE